MVRSHDKLRRTNDRCMSLDSKAGQSFGERQGLTSVTTSLESPWQNRVAERWIESCRGDLLDHVIAFNELHLKRVLPECVRHYHGDRTHLELNKETHERRAHSRDRGEVVAFPRLSGSHYRYERAA